MGSIILRELYITVGGTGMRAMRGAPLEIAQTKTDEGGFSVFPLSPRDAAGIGSSEGRPWGARGLLSRDLRQSTSDNTLGGT